MKKNLPIILAASILLGLGASVAAAPLQAEGLTAGKRYTAGGDLIVASDSAGRILTLFLKPLPRSEQFTYIPEKPTAIGRFIAKEINRQNHFTYPLAVHYIHPKGKVGGATTTQDLSFSTAKGMVATVRAARKTPAGDWHKKGLKWQGYTLEAWAEGGARRGSETLVVWATSSKGKLSKLISVVDK